MTTIAEIDRAVTGGVDTHTDIHVAAVVDAAGKVLGSESFLTTLAGCRRLLAWMRGHGRRRGDRGRPPEPATAPQSR